jgi:hypothetical protein
LTLNDLEYNREAATVNGRLRHLVNTNGSLEEANKLCEEAVSAGIQLDMQSYIYLSTLVKPQMMARFNQVATNAGENVKQFFDAYVPDPEHITALFNGLESNSEESVTHLKEIIQMIKDRQAKLDINAIQALFAAHQKASLPESAAFSLIEELHHDFLIDTPTYDTYTKLFKSKQSL